VSYFFGAIIRSRNITTSTTLTNVTDRRTEWVQRAQWGHLGEGHLIKK